MKFMRRAETRGVMTRVLRLCTVHLALIAISFAALEAQQPSQLQVAKESQSTQAILGFTPAGAALERHVEEQFLKIPSPERAREWHKYLTAEPHPAASARNNELAEYIAEQWRQQGWEDVVLRSYDVLHSSPREVSLEMVAPVKYKATLREAAY